MDTFTSGQNQILERIASGAPLPELLNRLVQLIESQTSEMTCSILLLDEDGQHLRHGAAPSLPEPYVQAIDGLSIGPKAGSCGTAAYFGKTVVVTDTEKDPLWNDYRELARKYGFRACWSSPIRLRSGQISGTFAMYYRVPRGPHPEELRLAKKATHLASIAIESRRTEESLRKSKERSRAILRAIPDSMFLLDSDFNYLECQFRGDCKVEIPRAQLLGKNMRDVLTGELADMFESCFQKASESGELQVAEYDFSLDGKVRHNEARIIFTTDRKFLVLVRDITEARMATEGLHKREDELRKSYAQIRELAGRLMTAQEEERRRISRELHDDLNQKVAALSIIACSISHQLPAGPDGLTRHLEMLKKYCIEIAEGIRRLSHELHPAVLEHAGLVAALRAYVTEFSNLEGIRIKLIVPESTEMIPPDLSLCLYRVTQESLRNIVKHSGVNQAEVALSVDDDTVYLQVADTGTGFDLTSVQDKGGVGLASMEERVRLMQGSFRVATEPGAGCKLIASIPLPKSILDRVS